MHEKTLLYGALGFTAIAAAFAVHGAKSGAPSAPPAPITRVMLDDASRSVASAEVPVRLTASDGTGLRLVALRAQAAVEDPLALTELHLTFENPEDRVLEGTFRITLPQGASLSRFAMKVGGTWQEGEVVEKQAARQAYEDFLHRRQDPALMEQGAGNEFSARVFPIPARGTKELIVTYAESIEAGAPYVLPLRGLPQLGDLDVTAHVAGAKAGVGGKADATFALHQQRFTPASDFVVEGKQLARSPGLRSGDLAIARVVPFATSRPEPVGSAVVLVDTSASRGLGIEEQVRMLSSVLAKLPPETRVTVACFDQDVEPTFEGKAGDFGPKQAQAIALRGALGASDFEQALAWAGDAAKREGAKRVILLTDGVATAGETDAQRLRVKVEGLRDAGVTRIDAIAMGGIRDDGFLRTVVRGVLDRDGVVLDAKLGADALARRLGEATSSGVAVKVDGARWSWPETLDGLQAGDEVLVYAELDASRPVRIDVGGQVFTPDLRTTERPLVERAWAQAKIQSLVEAPKEGPAATKQQIVALSTRHRVISPYTALLVLETDADYRRFGIDRTAKLDILAVQDGRVAVIENDRGFGVDAELARRQEVVRPKGKAVAPPPAEAKKTESADTGGERERRAENAPTSAAAAAVPSAPPPAEPAPAPGQPRADGIGLSGTGEGGGGAGDAIGLGSIGTIGHGAGDGTGAGFGRGGGAPAPRPTPQPVAPAASAAAESARRPAPDPLADEPAPAAPWGTPRPPPAPNTPQQRRPFVRVPSDGASASVRPGAVAIDHGISADAVQPVVRRAIPRVRACYEAELARDPSASGRLDLRLSIDASGAVRSADVVQSPGGGLFRTCVVDVAKSLAFPAPGSGDARFTQSFDLVGGGRGQGDAPRGDVAKALPYEGRFKIVMDALSRGDRDGALTEASQWHADQPGDILSLVALGEVFEARGDLRSAARAYGSILELFSFRADSRRFAGERLERLAGEPRALALAIDTYGKAAEQRPDHPASHRLYAFALLKNGEHEKAFEALKKGATRSYPMFRFRGVDRILKEDLGLVAAAWERAEPARAAEIRSKLREAGGVEERGPSLRFVLNWETDANDVDFHIHDGKGGHAYYSQMRLPSGGDLYADVTTGYGPECFTIRVPREQRAYPYTLQAHYYSRGPMGYGMGKLQVVEHDGQGRLVFDERPFVVMVDQAYVDMGSVDKATKLTASR